MGCGCGGSNPQETRTVERPQRAGQGAGDRRLARPPEPRRGGGPGTPEYYWTGNRTVHPPHRDPAENGPPKK
jgi:hypothetical protein